MSLDNLKWAKGDDSRSVYNFSDYHHADGERSDRKIFYSFLFLLLVMCFIILVVAAHMMMMLITQSDD